MRLVLSAIALPSSVAMPLAVARAKGVRPNDADLEATVPHVKTFFQAAVRDGLGEAIGLSRSGFEEAALRHRAGLWPELSEADAVTLARLSAGHLNGEDTKHVVAELVIDAINAGRPIPPRIAPAAIALLAGGPAVQPRRGPDPDAHLNRNTIISVCVGALCMYGFSRTRNAATSERASACSVVAAIAGLSEAAVVKIDTTNRSNSRARMLEE